MSTSRIVLRALVFSLVGMVAVTLGVGALLADHWEVQTTRVLATTPARVRALVGDLSTWADWSAVDSALAVNLGTQTRSTVEGAPGTVGQRIVWTGPKGSWALTVTALGDDALEYGYARVDGTAPLAAAANGGRVTWVADGDRTRVTWIDRGTWDTLVQRWFGWFGALQQRVQQMQGSSLLALAEQLEREGR